MDSLILGSFRVSIIGVAGLGGYFVASDPNRAFWLSLAGIAALVLYRVFRQFKREAVKGWVDFLDRNIVETILAAIIAPNAATALLEAIHQLVTK